MINPKRTKLGPQDFELKKVLGRGGYGKVFQVSKRTSVHVTLIIGLFLDELWRWHKDSPSQATIPRGASVAIRNYQGLTNRGAHFGRHL